MTQEVIDRLIHRVEDNPFCQVMNMKVTEVSRGHLAMSVKISEKCHTNIYGYVHGGVFSGLADTACGVCCFTDGAKVVTLDMNLSYIKNVKAGATVYCYAEILQHGNNVMRTHCKIVDETNELLVDGTLSFYIIGKEDIGNG
ncbi:MAG: PaaI family thioesterase [Acidaminococcaceae bacterium]|nr:PaaI family thioesterase [Acidaminococcaceae bacterium]